MEERANKVEEVTGERIDDRHFMSVITGVVDMETLKQTAQFQGPRKSVERLKKEIMEFVNLVSGGDKGDAMDLSRVQESPKQEDPEEKYEQWEQEEWNDHWSSEGAEMINGLGETCHKCGG